MLVAHASADNYTWQPAGTAGITGDQISWRSVASSADGTHLAAAGLTSGLYTSADSGTTWTRHTATGIAGWSAVVTSSDGQVLVAAGSTLDGQWYLYGSRDGGTTLRTYTSVQVAEYVAITAAAISGDGTTIVAVASDGTIYRSTDSGATWQTSTPIANAYWSTASVSRDGSHLALLQDNSVYISTDNGATWVSRSMPESAQWSSVTVSGDGTTLYGAEHTDQSGYGGGSLYVSTDNGATWSPLAAAGTHYWNTVTTSEDGSRIVAIRDRAILDSSTDPGATWTQLSPTTSYGWTAVACSQDCTTIIVAEDNGSIYTSGDRGATWNRHTLVGSQNWSYAAISADGTRIAATNGTSSGVYISSTSGTQWTQTSLPGSDWRSITMSTDGAKLLTYDKYGGTGLEVSTDYGTTWTLRNPTRYGASNRISIGAAALSGDGHLLAAADDAGSDTGGYIYISTDNGTTWTPELTSGMHRWSSIAISQDGTHLIAADQSGDDFNGGYLYTSNDSGATWHAHSDAGVRHWNKVAMSADGTHLVALDSAGDDYTGGYIYTSSDGGVTWHASTSAGARQWGDVIISADGSKLLASCSDSQNNNSCYLYSSNDGGATWQTQLDADLRQWWRLAGTPDMSKVLALAMNEPLFIGSASSTNSTTVSEYQYAGLNSSQPTSVAHAVLNVSSTTCANINTAHSAVFGPDGVTTTSKGVTIIGGIGYMLTCTTPGDTADVTVTLGTTFTDPAKLRVYERVDSSATLRDITDQVSIANVMQNGTLVTTLRYNLVDGGSFDEDGIANGTIVNSTYIGLVQSDAALTLANTGENSLLFGGIGLVTTLIGMGCGVVAIRKYSRSMR